MTISGIVDGLRFYSAILSLIVAIVGTWQWRRWVSFLPVNQLAWLALALYNMTACYGSVESLVRHVPGGIRTPLTALAVTFALYAVGLEPAKAVWRKWRVHRIATHAAAQRPEREHDRTDPGGT